MRDSYNNFIKNFNISKDKFYEFGMNEIIYPDIEKVRENWNSLKNRIKKNEKVYIRGFGRDAKGTSLYLDLYKDVFNNDKVTKDPTNNNRPQMIIEQLTGLKRNKDIINYQVSHIFQKTKNIYMFEAPWNIILVPKIYDPFTGHETKGKWPVEFQKLFTDNIKERYSEFINDYNTNISDVYYNKIDRYISDKIDTLEDQEEKKQYEKFKKSILKEFERIT